MGKGAGPELNHPGWEGQGAAAAGALFGSVGRPAAAFTCSLESWRSSFVFLVAEGWVARGVAGRGGPAELAFSQPLQGVSDSKPHLNSFQKSLPHQLPLENRASPWPSGRPPWSSARRALRARTGVFLVEMRSTAWVRTKHDISSWRGQAMDQRNMRMMGYGDTSLPGKIVSPSCSLGSQV